jgi:mutator protein MutT
LIHVVAGAVVGPDGRVLIAQRPPGKQLAGHWEFPGGKLEAGESRAAGLARELREELGIVIRDPRPLMRVRHAYDFGEVLIDMWVVKHYTGQPRGLDQQQLRWCHQDELEQAGLLVSDRPFVRALRLPERLTCVASDYYAIGDSPTIGAARLQGAFCASLDEGVSVTSRSSETVDFLVMRRTTGPEELSALCASVCVPVFGIGLTLEEAWRLGATGVSELGIQ